MADIVNNCIAFLVRENNYVKYVEPAYLFCAILGGIIIGCVIAIIVARFRFQSLFNNKKKIEDQNQMEKQSHKEAKIPAVVNQYFNAKKNNEEKKVSKKRSRYQQLQEDHSENLVPTILQDLEFDSINKRFEEGSILTDAVQQSTEAAGYVNLLTQIYETYCNFEEDFQEEKIVGLGEIYRIYLNRLFQGGKIDQATFNDLLKNNRQRLKRMKQTLDAEALLNRDEILNSKDSDQEKSIKLNELPSIYNGRLRELSVDEETEIRRDVARYQVLTDQELDAFLTALVSDVTAFERKMALEHQRQNERLEKRLGKRRMLLAEQKINDEMTRDLARQNIEVRNRLLDKFVKDGRLEKDVKDKVLENYAADQKKWCQAQEQTVLDQQKKLSEPIREKKLDKLQEFDAKQMSARSDFLRKFSSVVNVTDFIEAFSNFNEKQRSEYETLVYDLDNQECTALNQDRQLATQNQASQAEELENAFVAKLLSSSSVSQEDAERLLQLHKQEMQFWKQTKDAEKRDKLMKLEETLAQRRMQMEQEQVLVEAEQETLKNQQEATLRKTMNLQMEISDDAKVRIMIEHEQNCAALNNQLQLSRSRQQKQMEAKIAARQMTISKLERELKDQELDRSVAQQDARQRRAASISEAIEKEKQQMALAHEANLKELHDRLALETQAALDVQEKQMAELIGRLQVGQARRQNIIRKNDSEIEELQNKIEKKLKESGGAIQSNQLEQILQQHSNQVENLNTMLSSNRKQQERLLMERLEQKRILKSREVEENINMEAEKTINNISSLGNANSKVMLILMGQLTEQRQQTAMKEMEMELQIELQKQREEMNRKMEQELESALEERRRNLMSQLSSISKLSEKDLNTFKVQSEQRGGQNGFVNKSFSAEDDSNDEIKISKHRKKKKRTRSSMQPS